MTDRITILGVSADGTHGVLPEEHRTPQRFVVDITLEVDLAPAGRSDDLAHTVNYAEVAHDIVAAVTGEHVDLIEVLAERIAAAALARPLVEAVEVTVHKPQAPVGVPFDDVTVRIRREADHPFVVALGGNLGSVERTLRSACRALAGVPGIRVTAISDLFDTDPVGGPDQPRFVNAVLLGRTRLHAHTLLARLQGIETDLGRTREVRWGPRTIDLDLIQVGDPRSATDVVRDDPRLTLPHPRAHERAFVLAPWFDADPSALLRHDGTLHAVGDLLACLEDVGAPRPWPHR
ncbi:MAG: 2-amino-4-hydroxy-6-hydroxymethyldihydropteridine diphosphokinase [Mobilicoccus sp.]|nr:2-amino-4-hydroxy-6-hydroxymethyldihydropteridine diphosphokinase [Mobilicoccus sp.]